MSPETGTPRPFQFGESASESNVHVEHRRGVPDVYHHYHQQFELLLVFGGQGRRVIGKDMTDYTAPELVLVGPELAHSWVAGSGRGGAEFTVVVFSRGVIGLELLARPDMKPLATLLADADRGLAFGSDAIDATADRIRNLADLQNGTRTLELLTILDRLARIGGKCILPPGRSSRPGRAEQESLHYVLRLIHEDENGELTLDDVARAVHMSVPTFTRFFRRMTGTTFVRYRNEWRVRKAQALLRESDESITAVALAAGFGNLSHFNRQFRRLTGATPREYRSGHRSGE
ncbi:MAG: AraC family transcriptional regulator [Planctomycetota bacterium]